MTGDATRPARPPQRVGTRRSLTCVKRLAATVIASLAATLGMAIAIQAGAPGADGWRIVRAPAGFAPDSISCVSADDCWATEGGDDADGVWHLAHGAWSAVSTEEGDGLRGLTCLSAIDCWAVGISVVFNSEAETPLIEHWGGDYWSPLTGADPRVDGGLDAVACVTATDCWAVGQRYSANPEGGPPLIEHYSEAGWEAVTAGSSMDVGLRAVTCVNAHDCVAVGAGLGSRGFPTPLVEEYDGVAWRPARLPAVMPGSGPAMTALTGVACAAGGACWAVGDAGMYHALVLVRHPNGGWTALPLLDGGQLTGVACTGSSAACWAVGSTAPTGPDAVTRGDLISGEPLVEAGSGNSWTALVVPSAPPPAWGGELLGVACVPSSSTC